MTTIRTILCFLILTCAAQAGVLRVTARLVVGAAKAITFPVRHPKRFWVAAPPQHGPTLPPDPWSDNKVV